LPPGLDKISSFAKSWLEIAIMSFSDNSEARYNIGRKYSLCFEFKDETGRRFAEHWGAAEMNQIHTKLN